MRVLNSLELNTVAGGEVGATKMGGNAAYTGYSTAQAVQCANTMMAYGGLGGVAGGLIGAVTGAFAGVVGAVGTLLGTQHGAKKEVCTTPQSSTGMSAYGTTSSSATGGDLFQVAKSAPV